MHVDHHHLLASEYKWNSQGKVRALERGVLNPSRIGSVRRNPIGVVKVGDADVAAGLSAFVVVDGVEGDRLVAWPTLCNDRVDKRLERRMS